MAKAILLVNMGGPSSLSEIKDYLRAIFRDPAILPMPGLIREILAIYISRKRAPMAAKRYELIGGASPLPKWTEKLKDLVEIAVKDLGKDVVLAHAFRYTKPTIKDAIETLAKNNINDITLVPLFPHFTRAMTGSIEREAGRVCKRLKIKLRSVPGWGNREEILAIWDRYIDKESAYLSSDSHLLFVAHGIPQRDVERGDDYPARVEETAKALGDKLPENVSWSLAFQSRVGPVKWTSPYLEDEIEKLGGSKRNLLLMPLSFVSDCLETLYDLDILAARQAQDAGFESVRRVRVFNDDPQFARALARIATGGSVDE